MAILINDMEVEVQAPEPVAQAGTNSQNTEAAAQSSLTPMDINTVLCQQFERMERVRSH